MTREGFRLMRGGRKKQTEKWPGYWALIAILALVLMLLPDQPVEAGLKRGFANIRLTRAVVEPFRAPLLPLIQPSSGVARARGSPWLPAVRR